MILRRAHFVLLTLLLLFAQQAALGHAVSHIGKQPPSKELLVHSNLCDHCASFAKVLYAAPGNGTALLQLDLAFAQPAAADYVLEPRTVAAYHSRAPPSSL